MVRGKSGFEDDMARVFPGWANNCGTDCASVAKAALRKACHKLYSDSHKSAHLIVSASDWAFVDAL